MGKSNEDRLAGALLPCPFCGGEPTKYPDPAVGVFVECQNDDCWSSPQVWGNDGQEAAYYWNRRSAHKASMAEVSDDELPGMWSNSDFMGGDPDERSYAQREHDAKVEVSEGEPAYGVIKCSCGHPSCRDYWLRGIGKFCQGSGFSKEEAELIAMLLNACASRKENNDGIT